MECALTKLPMQGRLGPPPTPQPQPLRTLGMSSANRTGTEVHQLHLTNPMRKRVMPSIPAQTGDQTVGWKTSQKTSSWSGSHPTSQGDPARSEPVSPSVMGLGGGELDTGGQRLSMPSLTLNLSLFGLMSSHVA